MAVVSPPPRTEGRLRSAFSSHNLKGLRRRRAAVGYLFLLPSLGGIAVFTAIPIVAALLLSLFRWNMIASPEFVGLANYERLFADARVLTTFVTTGLFVLLAVGLQLALGLALALGLQRAMPRLLRVGLRAAYVFPLLTSAASISIVLTYMFNESFGIVNYYLGLFGIDPIPWLNSSRWALIAVVLTFVWHQLGFTFLILLGGVASMPKDVLDAADVDGASGWRRLVRITIPLMSPSLLVASVIGFISAMQVFDQPFVMTRGGPGDATRTVVMAIYDAAFRNLDLGYGAAISVVLFAVILLLTGVQFRLSKRWVHYQ
jgi:multiple sugar transport system permease protein